MICSCVNGSDRTRTPSASYTCVGDGGRSGSLRSLPHTERRIALVGEEFDVHRGHLGEPQNRIALPGVAGDVARVEAHALLQRPTRRLDGTALDLILRTVGVDDQTGIDGDRQPPYPHLGDGLHFGDDRTVRAAVLVARIADAMPDRIARDQSAQPERRTAASMTARPRGSASCVRRYSIGSRPAAYASSSMKDSIAKTLTKPPSARIDDVRNGMTDS